MRNLLISCCISGVLLLALPLHSRAVDAPAIFAHTPGIWKIAPKGKLARWVVIHNLVDAKASGVFHVEVIGREQGAPAWKIVHVQKHMAITLEALQRSVLKPLKSGGVYPEPFDNAFAQWRESADKPVCDRSVVDCL